MSTALMAVDDVKKLASALVASKLFAVKNVDEAFTMMMICMAEGCHPMQAMQRYHIVQGRPAKTANAMLADYQKSGGKTRWIERTETACEAEFTSPGLAAPLRVRWTMEQAHAAGLTSKANWKAYPRHMLSARVISEGVSLADASARTMVTPEELDDVGGDTLTQMESRAAVAVGGIAPSTYSPEEISESDGEIIESTSAPVGDDVECWTWARTRGEAQGSWQSRGFEARRTKDQAARLQAELKKGGFTDAHRQSACLQYYNKASDTELSASECADLISRIERKNARAASAGAEISAAGVTREPGEEG